MRPYWNESSARAGAFLGGAIQVIGIARAFGFGIVGPEFTTFLKSGHIIAEILTAQPFYGLAGVTVLDMLTAVGWGLTAISLLQGDYTATAYGAVTGYAGIPVPYFTAAPIYNGKARQYNGML